MSRTRTSLPQLLAAATSWDSPTPRALLLKRLGRPWPSSLRCTHPSPPTCSFVPRVSVQFPLRAPVSAMSVHSTSPCTRDLAMLRASPCTPPSVLWPPTTTTYLPVGLSALWPCPCWGLSAVYPLTVRALAARSSSRTSAMLLCHAPRLSVLCRPELPAYLRACPLSTSCPGPSCPGFTTRPPADLLSYLPSPRRARPRSSPSSARAAAAAAPSSR